MHDDNYFVAKLIHLLINFMNFFLQKFWEKKIYETKFKSHYSTKKTNHASRIDYEHFQT